MSNRPINTGNINTGNINTGSSYSGGGGGGGGGYHQCYDDYHGDHWGYGSWYYGDDWPSPWAAGAVGLGLGWALGSASDSGYEYQNPYYQGGSTQGGDTNIYYNYSQPIAAPATQVAPSTATAAPADAPPTAQPPAANTVNSQATQLFDAARATFAKGDYPGAQQQVEQAIQLMPDDAIMHEFRALTLFAQGKYDDAAGAIYAVLAAGPPWDWETIQALYGGVDVYTQQLRKLEEAVKADSQNASKHFLLAYQYMCIGDGANAAGQLEEVTKLQPKDQLSAALLKSMQGQTANAQPAAGGQPGA